MPASVMATRSVINDAESRDEDLLHLPIADHEPVDSEPDPNDILEIVTPKPPPALMTSRSAAALGYLTPDLIIARAGVYDLVSNKELILRDEELTGIQEECAQSLTSLEILSLSHNKLTSLAGFQYFINLVELNLNFNQITSLDYLQCPALEKLFASNNKITGITSLRSFPNLNTLSVYGNLIADLEESLYTCRGLPKLRSLDLGGNPCSQELQGYKFQVVRMLSRLKTLDGEQVTQLDKELAEDYALQGRPATADSRPSTASRDGRAQTPRLWEAPSTPSKPFDPFQSKHMPKGNVRLFRDDFLNTNPILLEYLAQESQEASEDVQVASSGGGFVEKMRTANPLTDEEDKGELSPDDPPSEDFARPATPLRPSTASNGSMYGASTSHLGIDPSDPKATIRKLLKHIEVLEQTVASYTTRQVEASMEALMEENRRLQIENNNIPLLQEQIASLKKHVASANVGPCPPPTSLSKTPDAGRTKELDQENEKLRRENARLRQLLKGSEVSTAEPLDPVETVKQNCGKEDIERVKRLGDSTLLEESATLDVELTELILQNEVALELIRNDIKNTKKEWEQRFQEAKDREREQQKKRPQTSLGLSSEHTKRVEAPPLRPSTSMPTAPGISTKTMSTRSRQLHTSAGFRHGPEEHLLRHAAVSRRVASENGHSDTNILTL
ncbi:hypothetical protein Poli38472_002115 [Pythium oligandrum]|uniref:Uncharacterized protein n=1 Tax=Pythium oligandrum TaxID=41045 RepID=A0A8K1CGM6_PYTOL|nr:hypothetical protein Poli38472_002115 [Pythium oligandrum]|eukprot:TMW63174.1 hypothetical protein Poli38472_002115 [Pythium oligandrum]